jgi:hypothetical protein
MAERNLDLDHKIYVHYGVDIVPTTVIISPRGEILRTLINASESQLIAELHNAGWK